MMIKDDNYIEQVRCFEFLVENAIEISNKTAGKLVDTWEKQIASEIFRRICAISFSLLKILPESQLFKKISSFSTELWDYSSICSMTRTIIDTYLIFFHYCIDIPKDINEREFKKYFWLYFKNLKVIKILELNNSQLKELNNLKEENTNLFKKIEKNSYYIKFDKKKKDIENCKIFQIPINEEIAKKAGINNKFYKTTYDYLSSYIHSDSYSIEQLAIFKAGNNEAYQLITTVLNYLIIYLSISIRDFANILQEEIDNNLILIINVCEGLVKNEKN